VSVTNCICRSTANVLYFGDTGADLLENSTNIQTIWNYVAPMILNGSLGAIFLECSFPGKLMPD